MTTCNENLIETVRRSKGDLKTLPTGTHLLIVPLPMSLWSQLHSNPCDQGEPGMGVGPPPKQQYLGARLLKEKPEENHWCLSTPGCPQERAASGLQ